MYPKLKNYVSAVILDSYGYTPVAYVTVHCVVLPWLNWLSVALWVQEVS